MRFWFFDFEGWFSDDSDEYPGQGVFSQCLVQTDDFTNADFRFVEALTERKINLIEVTESFKIDTDPAEMDPENEDNFYWIKWCEETELSGKPTFEVFHLYPAAEVANNGKNGN